MRKKLGWNVLYIILAVVIAAAIIGVPRIVSNHLNINKDKVIVVTDDGQP